MKKNTTIQDYNQPIEQVKKDLESLGWWKGNCKDSDLDTYMLGLANKLGDPIGIRRKNDVIEVLEPTHSDLSYPNSLSKQFALSEFPFHCDTAHWPTPCRFIVIGCKEKGACGRTTNLVDWKLQTRDESEVRFLKYATFLFKHGRNSFFSSIIHEKALYARFDPGCMSTTSKESDRALRLFHSLLDSAEKSEVPWEMDFPPLA